MSASRRRVVILVVALLMAVVMRPSSMAHAQSASPAVPGAVNVTVRSATRDSLAPAAPDTARRARNYNLIQRELAKADSMLKARGGVHAEDAQLFLSWNAPWGMKRARTSLTPRCADTTATDTLYLSFLPGRASDGFSGFSARLSFHLTSADTLGPWWHMEGRGGENGGNMQVEYGPSPDMLGRQPWNVPGQGLVKLTRTPRDMNLLLLHAVSHDAASPIVSDSVYTLARIIIRHRRTDRLAGCGQPMCVEWVSATLGFALKDEPEVRRGERFVTYGADAHACDASRGVALPVWKPRK